jgi:cell division protein FtsI (penicillin-binding protein 3)
MLAAQDAYRANHLQQRLTTLTDAEQRLSRIVESDSAPAALRQRAKTLGMVPATISGFHKLRDGRAVGLQAPVQPPAPIVTQPTTPTAKPSNASKSGKPAAHHASKPATTSVKPGHAGKPGTSAGQQKKTATTPKHTVSQHPASKPPASKHHHSTTP